MDVNELSKEQLCGLVSTLRQRITDLESSEKGRRQTQAALCESVEIYHALLEISPIAIIITDLKAAVIMANQEALKMLGYGAIGEIIGKNLFSILAPEYRKKAKESMQEIIAGKQIRHTEGVLLKNDNTLVSVEVSFTTVCDMEGKAEGFIGAIKDVSERKEMEVRLRESESLYRSLSEGAITGVYIIQDNKFRYVNPALAQMFGYRVDEVIDKIGPAMFTYPPDRPLVLKQIKMRVKGDIDAARYSFRGVRKDGGIIHCECLGRRIMLDEKPAIIGTLLNITASKEAEEALRYKAELKTIIMSLSNRFMNMRLQNIDDALNDALRVIGEFAGVDRSYIFMFSSSGKTMDNTHEWCAAGIEPQIDRLKKLSLQSYPWFVKRIKKAQMVYVPSVENLTVSAAAEKKEWHRESIQSLINVPMVFQNEVIGFIGFDSVRKEKEWADDMRVLLRIIADMFAGIIKRREMDRDIKSLNKELLKVNMRLKQLALRDSLTGLYNHRYFEEAIEAEFMRAKRQALPLSVIMLDIDYFKSINDVYGHQFGDVVLKQLSGQLLSMVRKYDTVIRYGGEEFVIITPGANKEISLILAQRLLDVIKLYNFGDKEHSVKLKLSMAVSSFPEDKINTGQDFIKIADYILNKVKETGGDRVYSYLDITRKSKSAGLAEEESSDIAMMKEKLEKLTKRANQSLVEAIFAFAKTIEIKDHYTGKHVEKTVHYATEIAKAKGLSKEDIELVKQSTILHDLGKIGISEKILFKRSKLTPKEYEEIKKHPQIGADILRPIHFFHAIIPFVLHHHERWDGKGYPYGLKGEETPLGARIIALADAFEAITADRRYRKACSTAIAVKKIKKASGTQFDPEIVKLFLEIIRREEEANGDE